MACKRLAMSNTGLFVLLTTNSMQQNNKNCIAQSIPPAACYRPSILRLACSSAPLAAKSSKALSVTRMM